VTLRAAAVAAAYGSAILAEVATLAPFVELPEQTASLSLLHSALRSALARAASSASSEKQSATCAGVWALCEKRFAEAVRAVREAAREAEVGGTCPCGQGGADYQRSAGPPVICSSCSRVFHAACAGSPDELFVCQDCNAGVFVVRMDDTRPDMYVMADKEKEDNDDSSLGKILWMADRNNRAALRSLQ
jgi:hypothetical protein